MSKLFAHLGMTLPVDYRTCSQSMRREVREEYIRRQEGKCDCCKQPLSGPPARRIQDSHYKASLFPVGFLNYPIHLHHCHQTGMTIGAVHARCNAYLWQYKGE